MVSGVLGGVVVRQIQKKFDLAPAQAFDAKQVRMREAGELP